MIKVGLKNNALFLVDVLKYKIKRLKVEVGDGMNHRRVLCLNINDFMVFENTLKSMGYDLTASLTRFNDNIHYSCFLVKTELYTPMVKVLTKNDKGDLKTIIAPLFTVENGKIKNFNVDEDGQIVDIKYFTSFKDVNDEMVFTGDFVRAKSDCVDSCVVTGVITLDMGCFCIDIKTISNKAYDIGNKIPLFKFEQIEIINMQ